MKKSMIFTCCIYIFLLLCCTSAYADVYKHISDDGTVSFTDTPMNKNDITIFKDPPKINKINKKNKTAAVQYKKQLPLNKKETKPDQSQYSSLPINGRITSIEGLRIDPFNGKLEHHNGVDIAAPTGTPVKPVAPGRVIFSGVKSGYGNCVIIDHLDGCQTVYGHHSKNLVSVGDMVDTSTIIALTGSTGRSTGPHLHFEAWRNGENITNSFLPASYQSKGEIHSASVHQERPIKRVLQSDGTLLFTNL